MVSKGWETVNELLAIIDEAKILKIDIKEYHGRTEGLTGMLSRCDNIIKRLREMAQTTTLD